MFLATNITLNLTYKSTKDLNSIVKDRIPINSETIKHDELIFHINLRVKEGKLGRERVRENMYSSMHKGFGTLLTTMCTCVTSS